VWYLFGAWLLAATMNAMLTWWGVSLAILNHDSLGNAVIGRETMLRIAPIFVAVLVWLIRVLDHRHLFGSWRPAVSAWTKSDRSLPCAAPSKSQQLRRIMLHPSQRA